MNVSVIKQRRQTLALQLTPKGLRILIPNTLNEDDRQVKEFIDRSLKYLPEPPVRLHQPHSHDAVIQLVNQWAEKIEVKTQRVQIRAMSTKWGSISTAGYLTLADDLLWLPLDLVEYVVIHELLHLKFPNHAKGWQVSMNMFLPNWRRLEKELQAFSSMEANCSRK